MRRRLALLSLSLLLLLGVAGSSLALPDGRTGSDTIWYEDETFQTVVGERYMDCNGYPSEWGDRSVYVEYYSWSCPDYTPIPAPCYTYVCGLPTDDPNTTTCQCTQTWSHQ